MILKVCLSIYLAVLDQFKRCLDSLKHHSCKYRFARNVFSLNPQAFKVIECLKTLFQIEATVFLLEPNYLATLIASSCPSLAVFCFFRQFCGVSFFLKISLSLHLRPSLQDLSLTCLNLYLPLLIERSLSCMNLVKV